MFSEERGGGGGGDWFPCLASRERERERERSSQVRNCAERLGKLLISKVVCLGTRLETREYRRSDAEIGIWRIRNEGRRGVGS